MEAKIKRMMIVLIAFTLVFACYPMMTGEIDSHAASNKIKMLTVKATGETSAYLSWSKVKNAKGYTVFRNGEAVAHLGKKAKSYSDTGLTPDKSYNYIVKLRTTKKVKYWYNKKTGQWQKKKPGKKIRGKSKNLKVYSYKGASPVASVVTPISLENKALKYVSERLSSNNGYSRTALIEDLLLDYSQSVSEYAVNNCGADWNEQAVLRAKKLANEGDGYSRNMMAERLRDEYKFTQDEAAYGADHCGADWNEQAVKEAKYRMSYDILSRAWLIYNLTENGLFTQSQAEYGADHCGADWNEMAAKEAGRLIRIPNASYTRESLISSLENSFLYTHDQAVYGADHCGKQW